MKIFLDNQPLHVSETVVDGLVCQMRNKALEFYDQIPGTYQAMISMAARKKLADMEMTMYHNGATKEEAQSIRPSKGKDAALHMLDIIIGGAREMLEHVEIRASRVNDDSIENITVEFKDTSETGRQLAYTRS